jgi:hypothetical protein
MGDREEGNLVGIKGYEEFDLNDPNFMRFIKRRMKSKNMTEEEAIADFENDMKEQYAKKNKKAQGGFAKGSAEGSTIKMKPMRMKSGGLAKRGYGKARR